MSIENVPHIQPDEWLNFYFERLAILNGYKNASNMFKKLEILKGKVEFISSLLNISIKTIVQEYTLLPAFRSIVSIGADIPHGDPSQPNLIKLNSIKAYSGVVRFCPQCQQEDVDYLGYPYVRRSHQLFGVLWCQKHNIDLFEVPKEKAAEVLRGRSDNLFDRHKIKRHPIIDRFVHISDALLSEDRPPHGDQVSWGLSKRAELLGIRSSIGGEGIPLSDHANQLIPHDWLHKFFPMLKSKATGHFIPAIDGACVFRLQHHFASTYILAAALLFDDPDDALNCVLAKEEIPPPRAIMRRNEAFWNSDDLYQLYIKHKGNSLWICDEIGGHYETVRINLAKHGLPPLTGLSAVTIKALLDFHEGGNLLEILSRHDIQVDSMQYILRHASPKLFRALKTLKTSLTQQRKELRYRLASRHASADKTPTTLDTYHHDGVLTLSDLRTESPKTQVEAEGLHTSPIF